MAQTHRDPHSDPFARRAFLASVVWIVVLIASYWVLADWHSLPALWSATIAAFH